MLNRQRTRSLIARPHRDPHPRRQHRRRRSQTPRCARGPGTGRTRPWSWNNESRRPRKTRTIDRANKTASPPAAATPPINFDGPLRRFAPLQSIPSNVTLSEVDWGTLAADLQTE